MDAAKKPESLLAGGALVTALTTAIYLNKQQNSLSTQIDEVKEHLASSISELKQDHDKLDKHDKHIAILADGVRQLNALKIEQSELFDYFYQILMDRGKVIEALVESVSEIQSLMVKNGTEFKNGSIRELVDFSEQDPLADMPNNSDIQRSRQIPLDRSQAKPKSTSDPRMDGPDNSSRHDGRNGFNRGDDRIRFHRGNFRENGFNGGDDRDEFDNSDARDGFDRDRSGRDRFERRETSRGDMGRDKHINNSKQEVGNNARSSLPQNDELEDSDDEIEAQMNAMRSRRGDQLDLG